VIALAVPCMTWIVSLAFNSLFKAEIGTAVFAGID
jgi:hypothetical protein